MAKISTTLEIKQNNVSIIIHENGRFQLCATFWGKDISDAEKTLEEIGDLEHVIEVFKKHITDRH